MKLLHVLQDPCRNSFSCLCSIREGALTHSSPFSSMANALRIRRSSFFSFCLEPWCFSNLQCTSILNNGLVDVPLLICSLTKQHVPLSSLWCNDRFGLCSIHRMIMGCYIWLLFRMMHTLSMSQTSPSNSASWFALRHIGYALFGTEPTTWTPCHTAIFFNLRVMPWL